jgi:hypothetical protein
MTSLCRRLGHLRLEDNLEPTREFNDADPEGPHQGEQRLEVFERFDWAS